jgi:hypothetical protein
VDLGLFAFIEDLYQFKEFLSRLGFKRILAFNPNKSPIRQHSYSKPIGIIGVNANFFLRHAFTIF